MTPEPKLFTVENQESAIENLQGPSDAEVEARPAVAAAETDADVFRRLARLTPPEYDRVRQGEATRLGIRLETLDAEVARRRPQRNGDVQGQAIELQDVEPWPTPVDGAEVLREVSERYRLRLVLPPGAPDACALWTGHTHAFAAFLHTPRLNLYSPDGGCGKTTALDVIASMVPRPLRFENLTAPVLFRLVDQHQPTLLLDEVDAYLSQAEELRGLLNAGHKRGAHAFRCEGEGKGVRAFKAFAPAVLAGIGSLPGTLHDRSIAILLVPAKPDEVVAPFDALHCEAESVLARKLARWCQDNLVALQACEPRMPGTAFNRLADNWRPLFAIAQVAGGDWPERALAAFTQLTAKRDLDAQSQGITLLADIRQVFSQSGSASIFSRQLVEGLCSLPDRPWPEAHQGNKPITETWLARRLRRFGIDSRTLRIGERVARGYNLADFAEAFGRFLAREGTEPEQGVVAEPSGQSERCQGG